MTDHATPATGPWTCLLFDIDGTIADSADVVVDVFEEVLASLGVPVPPRSVLRPHVGPPLWTSMPALGVPDRLVAEAVEGYRVRYLERFLEPPLFDGVAELLADLHGAGIALATATSKQEPMAVRQMEHLGIGDFFAVVAGATPGPDSTKETVIRDALGRFDALGVDTSAPLLIGDRCWDLEGGQAVGIGVAGVEWGYAEAGELDGAAAVFSTVEQARDYLLATCVTR